MSADGPEEPAGGGGSPDVLILGTLTLDTVENPEGGVIHTPGGSAPFAAAGAAHWARARLLSVAGPDYPVRALADLTERGIDVTGLRSSDAPTQRWHARYDGGGNRTTVSSDRRILDGFRPTLTPEEGRARALLLGSIHPQVQRHVLEQWRTARGVAPHGSTMVVLDSMTHWIRAHRDTLWSLLPSVTVMFGTSEELTALADARSPEAAAAALLTAGPRVVVEKRGADGARAFTLPGDTPGSSGGSVGEASGTHEAAVLSIPAVAADAVDPTGAGDAFCGAFIGRWITARRDDHPSGSIDLNVVRAALNAGTQAAARAISAPSWNGLTEEAD